MTAAIRLNLTPKAQDFVRTIFKKKHVVIAGGWGGGKTSGLVYAAYKCAFRWLPGQKGIIAAPTYNQLESGFLTLWQEYVNPKYYKIKWGRTPRIECFVGKGKKSIIYLASGQYPKRIESKNVSWACGDELQDMGEFWDRVCGRVRDKRADILRTFGAGLTEQGYMEELVKRDGVVWIPVRSADNPHLHPSFEADLRRRLNKRQIKIYVDGEFAPPEAAVHPGFYSQKHCDTLEIDPTLPLFLGQDFNLCPMAGVLVQLIPACMQHDAPRCFHIVGEVVEDGTTVEAAQRAAALIRSLGFDPKDHRQVVCIPDATGIAGQHARGESDVGIFMQEGFAIRGPAYYALRKRLGYEVDGPCVNPLVRDRDNAVNALLENGEGLARLFVDPKKAPKTAAALGQLQHKGRKESIHDHPDSAVGYVVSFIEPIKTQKPENYRVTVQDPSKLKSRRLAY